MSLPFRRHSPLHSISVLLGLTLFAFGSGCVVHWTIGDPDGTGGSGGYAAPPPDPASAGHGGTCPAGSSSVGPTGAGGSSACVGAEGTGQTAASCDTMEITPSKAGGPAASNCDRCGGTGGTHVPPGYALCLAGFEIYTAGAAENLQTCFAQIDGAPASACDLEPVAACVSRMYNDACPSQAASDTCHLIEYALCGTDEPFDVSACAQALKPFNDGALERVEGCIVTSGEPDCRTAYAMCFDQITSY